MVIRLADGSWERYHLYLVTSRILIGNDDTLKDSSRHRHVTSITLLYGCSPEAIQVSTWLTIADSPFMNGPGSLYLEAREVLGRMPIRTAASGGRYIGSACFNHRRP